jgi:hypothetical protein
VQASLFPTFLLVIYKLLIGKAVLAVTGSDSLYGLVPMCAVVGAIFGTLGAGLAVPAERESGLLTRLWVLPIHRASPLTGRLLAEATRTIASAVVLTAFGVALGLRFVGGWEAAVPFVLVPVMMTWDKSLNSLAPRGMMALYGQSSGPIGTIDPGILNTKGSLFLTRPSLNHHIASRQELTQRAGEVLGWIASGALKLRMEFEFPLKDAAAAHKALEGRQTTGKVLLVP